MNNSIKTLFLFFLIWFLIHILDNKIGTYPPLGKFLDPFHGYISSDNSSKQKIKNLNIIDNVEIIWDENNIPHIFAENEIDMYMAQGYVVASDRLWQMDFISRLHAGKLSEIIGDNKEVLKNDRFMRRLGIVDGAKASLSTIATCVNNNNDVYKNWDGLEDCPNGYSKEIKDYDVYEMLISYSKGVNFYIRNLNWDGLPIEYKILDYSPEYWSPLKTCILLKAMTLDLSGRNTDLLYTSIVKEYGIEEAKFLYPEKPYNNDPIIDEAESISTPTILPENCDENLNYSNLPFYFDIPEMHNPGIGSNNWAVHKDKTENKNALLANDPHLGLNLPNVWYVMQISSFDKNNKGKTLDVMGATIPGAPGILSGFNNYIAWGETNGEDDVADFYQIEIDPNNPNNYIYDGESIPFEIKEEKIIIRGDALHFPKIFIDTIKVTKHHGPIIIDSNNLDMTKFDQGISTIYTDINLALKWIAHHPTQEITAFYKMNHATNYKEFLQALEYYECPSQNFVYADIKGNIAMHHNGKIPIRCSNYNKNILPGNSGKYVWDDFIPFEELPKIKNPKRGFVSSANQHPIPDNINYYYLPGVYWPSHRGSRINDLLNNLVQDGNVTINDMKNIQNDNFNKYAKDILPYLLKIISNQIKNDQTLLNIYDALNQWGNNPTHEADMFEPTIFDSWYSELNELVWADLFLDKNGKQKYNSNVYPLYDRLLKIVQSPDQYSFWIDDRRTEKIETIEEIVWLSFNSAIEKIKEIFPNKNYKEWHYSDYRGTDIHHLISSSSFDAFSRLDIPTSGSRWSPNAMRNRFGPSWRYIVEMSEGNINAIGIYPGGQSGNPNSTHYDDYIDKWNDGQYLNLNYTYYHNKAQLNGQKVLIKNED